MLDCSAAAEILQVYYGHLGPFEQIPVPLGNGHIHHTFLAKNTIGKRFVLQKLNSLVFADVGILLKNHVVLQDFFEKKNYPYQIPRLLLTGNGELGAAQTESGIWRLMDFCAESPDGAPPLHPNEIEFSPSDTAQQIAQAYGQFIAELADFPAETITESIPNFHHTPLRWRRFLEVLALDPCHRVADALPEIDALFAWKPTFERVFRALDSGELPLRLMHNDAKADNILLSVDGRQVIAVLDWDTVMPGILLTDFGDLVRSLAPNLPENSTDFDAIRVDKRVISSLEIGFLAGLGDKISASEKEALPLGGPWIVGEQALRFLTDFLEGDVYYPIDYPHQNLDRAKNQLNVLARLQDSE